MMWPLMWLNRRITIIKVMLQLLERDIYIYIYIDIDMDYFFAELFLDLRENP